MDPTKKVSWKDSMVELMILEMLRRTSFAKVDELATQLLHEVFLTNLGNPMSKTKSIAELNQRREVSIFDLLKVLESEGNDVSDQINYARKNKDRFEDSKDISDGGGGGGGPRETNNKRKG